MALRAARESIVLLKNQGGLLPLSKQLKRILVTGPNATSTRHSLDRYGPNGSTVISVLEGIRAAVSPGTEVLYAKGTEVFDKRWPESEIFPEPPTADEKAQIDEAVRMAKDVDVVKSRTDLNLTGFQNDLVKALSAFAYSDLTMSPTVIPADGRVTVSLSLTNTGSRAGDEVVQLYLQDVVGSVTSYDMSLRGFERVSLQPGEKRRVTFSLGKRDLELLDRAGRWTVEPGAFKVMMGSPSTDIRIEGRFEVSR